MNVQQRVMNIYRANQTLGITQLRLGRIIRMEHKELLDDKSDEEILKLLDPNNQDQQMIDNEKLDEIKQRKQWYE